MNQQHTVLDRIVCMYVIKCTQQMDTIKLDAYLLWQFTLEYVHCFERT